MPSPSATEAKARLKHILQEKSYLRGGEYILTSGEKSNVFFDVKMTSMDPEGATLSADLLLDMLGKDEITAVGGLAVGACPIVSAMCVQSFNRGTPLGAFYVRKECKEHGTRKQVEGFDLKPGDTVVVVDDVATKGGSMLDAIRPLVNMGCQVTRVIAIVDREQGAKERLAAEGYTLESIFTRSDLE